MSTEKEISFNIDFRNIILSLNNNVSLLAKQTANNYGFSSKVCNILFHIHQQDNLTLNDLSNLLNEDKGNLSRLINELIDLDLLYKEKDETDNRKFYIHITNKGENIITKVEKECSKNIEKILGTFSSKDKLTLINFIKQLNANIQILL